MGFGLSGVLPSGVLPRIKLPSAKLFSVGGCCVTHTLILSKSDYILGVIRLNISSDL